MTSAADAPAAGARARRAWMMFDWAAQPFHTLIVTFVFAPFFASAVAPDPATGQELWGWAGTVGGLAVALLAPVLGAAADATGPRKPWIAGFSVVYVAGASALWIAEPGADALLPILLAFVIAMLGVEFATVFTNAMLPKLASGPEVGRLSGNGWALGYVGGVLALAVMLGLFAENAAGVTLLGAPPPFGLDAEAREGTRVAGPFSALWYVVFVAPLFLHVPDEARRGSLRGALKRGFSELGAALRSLKTRPSLSWFLGASMFYRDALNGFYFFGGIYAAGVLGWSIVQIGVFGIVAAVIGALGAWAGGRADAAFGPRPVVMTSLWVLMGASLLGVSASRDAVLFFLAVGPESSLPDGLFYLAGALVGAAGGALQASSRSLLVKQAEAERMTAAFGIYALAGRATAFLAPLSVSLVTGWTRDQQAGIAPVIVLFAVGLMMMVRVEETEA